MNVACNSTRYLQGFLLAFGLAMSLVFALNFLIDPLWFFGGNRLQDKNFAFNERLSKSVLLDRNLHKYDCLILGSSRATLIDVRDIPNYRCFNYSVGGGTLADSLHLSKFAAQKISAPAVVFVSVDDFNWVRASALNLNRPSPFSRDISDKLSPFKHYFGLSALWMSVRTLLNSSPVPRYYAQDFNIQVRADAPKLADGKPRHTILPPQMNDAQLMKNLSVVADAIHGIRAAFPHSRLVGFVPFTAKGIVAANLDTIGVDRYTDAQMRIAVSFDDFYDFSISSKVTTDPSNTYDGSHFFPKVNATLIRQMALQEESDISVRINSATRMMSGFKGQYQAKLTGVSISSGLP